MTNEDPRVWIVAKALFDEANCVGTRPEDYEHQATVVLRALDATAEPTPSVPLHVPVGGDGCTCDSMNWPCNVHDT